MKFRIMFFILALLMFANLNVEEAEANVFNDLNKFVIDVVNGISKFFGGGVVGKPPNTHFTCVNGQCKLVDGAGVDECLESAHCSGDVQKCVDGTPFGMCVTDDEPKYCYGAITGGEVVDKCSVCGCKEGFICGDDDVCFSDGSDDLGNGGDTPGNTPSLTCTTGENKECGSSIGECVSGVQTCVNCVWGDCIGGVGPAQEICGDNKDNDCDGKIDEDCSMEDDDEDKDGLSDAWEIEYFSDLRYGWNDDPDKDGVINGEEYALDSDPSVAHKENKILLYVGSGVVLLIIVFLIVLFGKKSKKKKSCDVGVGGDNEHLKEVKDVVEKKQKKVKEGVAKEGVAKEGVGSDKKTQIKDYVDKAKAKGYTDEQIRDSLLRAGWTEEQLSGLVGV